MGPMGPGACLLPALYFQHLLDNKWGRRGESHPAPSLTPHSPLSEKGAQRKKSWPWRLELPT